MSDSTCSIEPCGKPAASRGLCNNHYRRLLRYGDPLGGKPTPLAFPENLLARMEPQPNGCIHYTGALDKDGYGQLKIRGKQVKAHRAAYEHFVGPIPGGLTVDHECHNSDETCIGGPSCLHRRCVNPEHLAPASRAENLVASPNTWGGRNARKTHCPKGHEYTPENTYVNSRGARVCRICQKAAWRAQNEKRRKKV